MREVKKKKKGEMKEGKERGWWRKILMGGFGKEREREDRKGQRGNVIRGKI